MTSLFKRGDGRIKFEDFTDAVKSNGYPEPSHATYWAFLNAARNFYIFDKQELAMCLAHFLHESDGFMERRENVNTENYPEEYKDESCDFPGQLYFGRGYLKLAKCKNYREASLDLYNDERLVKDPDVVAKDEDSAMEAGFAYWNRNVHNVPGVSDGKFGATTKALTGGIECLEPNISLARKRFEIYKNVRKGFKLSGRGDESGCYELNEFIDASKSV